MKIKSLHLVNFRIYEEIVIELADINIFSGDNGGGKTTIREAIEFLLTGRCQWTDARGVGKEELIRTGAAELMVEADIEGIGLVRRSIPGGLSIEGWTGTSADQQKILFQQLGADADTITAVLNSTYFLALEDAEQANMIFNLMGAKFNQTSLLKAFEKYSVCFTSDEIDTFNKFYPKNLTGGPEVFEKLEKVFRDKRTETNRVVKELKVLQGKQTKPEGYIECTANEKAQAEMRLSALRHERDIFVAAGAGETERTEQRERTQKRVDDTKTAIGKLQGQKDATEFDAERFLRLTDEMAANWVKIKAFQEEENLAKEKSDRLSGEINALQNTHDSLTENGGNCPLAPEHLKCPVGETDRYKLANTILKDLNKKRRELEEANGSLSKIRISKNAAVAGVESLETEIDILARTKEKIREIDQSIADSTELLGQYEEDLAAIPAANNDENHDEEITQLNDKILEVEGQVTKMVASLQYKANADSLKKQLAEKEHDSGSLESLIEDFGPKGIKQKMIAKTIEQLQAKAAERVGSLTQGQYSVQFDLSDGFKILVDTPTGRRKSKYLSTSEKMRVGIAMQDVLNGLAPGLGIMIVDDAEALTPDNKIALINTVLNLEDFGTVIVLAARGETEPSDPGVDGLAIFSVSAGQVRRV